MKKNRFLILIILVVFIMMPVNVKAEGNYVDDVYMDIEDIYLDEKPKETSVEISSNHLNKSVPITCPIIWYESTDGINYKEMDMSSTFDYNIYYKIVFGTTFSEISDKMDEGWECNNIILQVFNNNELVDTKKYDGSSTLEYIYEPFWKYSVKTYISNITYEGPTEVVEGEHLFACLIPEQNYRLPEEYEVDQGMIRIYSGGEQISFSYYYNNDNSTASIGIEAEKINGDIEIIAYAFEKNKKEFIDSENKTFIINSEESLSFQIDNDNVYFDYVYLNGNLVATDNYEFDKDTGILTINKDFLNTLEIGEYLLRLDSYKNYAETTFMIESEISYKVIFDANEGTFENGTTLTIENWENGMAENLEVPTRENYVFLGFFTEKNGGTKLELILSESGIDSDMTFYAQWKENDAGVVEPQPEEEIKTGDNNNNIDNTNNNNTTNGNNPQTSDNILLFIGILFISLFGLIVTSKYRKYCNKK